MTSETPSTGAREAAAAMFAEDLASRHLGVTIEDVAPGKATARMTITDTMLNGHGIAHGGYVFTLADTAFAFASNTYDDMVVARNCEIAFLRPVQAGDELVATAVERVRMRRSGIYDVEVRRATGEIVAEFRGHGATITPREKA
jgi:acyl-CoA thioesterase